MKELLVFIVYIAFGFVFGTIAAIVTLLSGSTLFVAFLAYILAGIGGMTAGLLWSLAPRDEVASKAATTPNSWTNL